MFVVNVDGTLARRITPWNVTLKAEWSPDGQWIAFDKAESEPVPRDLFVVHPDGTGLGRVTSNEDNKMSFAPTWSSDSETLLFIRREYGVDGTELMDRERRRDGDAPGDPLSPVTRRISVARAPGSNGEQRRDRP